MVLAGGCGQSIIVTEEQDTTQVPASLTDSSVGPVSREALYEMVWSSQCSGVAARFGVVQLHGPRLHAAQHAAAGARLLGEARGRQSAEATAAPEPRPGDPQWTRDGLAKRARPPEATRPAATRKRTVSGNFRIIHWSAEPSRCSSQPPLLSRQIPQASEELLVDSPSPRQGWTKPSPLRTALPGLGGRDHRVVIAPNSERFHRADIDEREALEGHHHNNLWSPMRCTVVYIGTVAIGLTVSRCRSRRARYVNGEYLTDSSQAAQPVRAGLWLDEHPLRPGASASGLLAVPQTGGPSNGEDPSGPVQQDPIHCS